MPSPDLYCEVRTTSGTYRDWLTVQVSQDIETRWMRTFRLTCAEPRDKVIQRLKPGDRVDIAMAGFVVIDGGFIETRQAAYDANRHGVQISGYSKAGPLTKVSADAGTGQFRGYPIEAIANRLLKPHGLKFKVQNGPDGWDTPFPNVVIHDGETPFDAISRLCRQRGLWLWAEANGDLAAGSKDASNGGGLVFTEGVNILSASCTITMPLAEAIKGNAQQPGSDSLFGRKAAEISAQSKLSDGIPGLARNVLAEMPLSQKELQLRTNMEAQAIEASRLQVSLAYQGWLNPAGKLWDLSEFVTVKSPMLFPTESGQLDLKAWGYTYAQTPEGQTTASVDLRNKAAWNVQHPDATTSDGFFGANPSPAQPEAST
ncbi:phage baseplate assembly protein [Methylobacterium sp. A49B]